MGLCGPWKWRGWGEASRWRLRRLEEKAGEAAVMAGRRGLWPWEVGRGEGDRRERGAVGRPGGDGGPMLL
nr:unnamed protein product [Digitaria exilis]